MKSKSYILSSIFFSFEVFDVFRNIGRSFSSNFCFLIFFILVCALTRRLNYTIFGEKQLEVHYKFSSHSQCSFLEPVNCYLTQMLSFCCKPSIHMNARPGWTGPGWVMRIIHSPRGGLPSSAVSFACTRLQARLPDTEAFTRKASNLLSLVVSVLLQFVLAVGISSTLNYHTCHLDPGRMNGTTHIMLQKHFLSKCPLQAAGRRTQKAHVSQV